MLKTVSFLVLALAINKVDIAQTNTPPLPPGNIGIGTASIPPQALLDLGYSNGVKALFYGAGGNSSYYWGAGVDLGQTPNEASIFIGGAAGSCCGPENFAVVSANQNTWPYTSFTTRFVVNSQSGNVGIGTLNVSDPNFKLFVETGIRTRKVTVDQVAWPDFVFHPAYNLPSLDRIAQFIQSNHHLPEIPSADSVAKNGLDLGGNQAKLLQKIEELTLYLIAQNKELEILKKQNKEFQSLQQRIDRLEMLIEAKVGK